MINYIKQKKYLDKFEKVLDFGCGVGRCDRAFSNYFKEVIGIDISSTMIDNAKKYNNSISNCNFIVNKSNTLDNIESGSIDLIYSIITLQHFPSKKSILKMISEFVRVLKNGGLLIFQLPCVIPFRFKLQIRRKLYNLLKFIGFSNNILYYRMNLHPIRLIGISEKIILKYLNGLNVSIVGIKKDKHSGDKIEGNLYFVRKN